MSKTYELSGGSKVDTFKPFGDQYYLAIVEQNSRYPEKGSHAVNENKLEFIIVLEGELIINLNGKKTPLSPEQSILIKDQIPYTIEGKGKALVFVSGNQNAKTNILTTNLEDNYC